VDGLRTNSICSNRAGSVEPSCIVLSPVSSIVGGVVSTIFTSRCTRAAVFPASSWQSYNTPYEPTWEAFTVELTAT
jgi:hypothetical protein